MLTTGQVTVGTAVPSQIDGSSASNTWLTIHNVDNTKTLYLGDSTVTTLSGLPLLKQETIQIALAPGEALYAISSGGDHVLAWLRQVL